MKIEDDYGFIKFLEEAKQKALREGIEANTIILDEKFKKIEAFRIFMDPLNTVLDCPPSIVGLFPKFANLDIFGGDFVLFKANNVPETEIQKLRRENSELKKKLESILDIVEEGEKNED